MADPNKYPNPADDPAWQGDEQLPLFSDSTGGEQTSTSSSAGNVRQQRGGGVQRVSIVQFEPDAERHLVNLKLAIVKLEHLMRTHTAPELEQRAAVGAERANDRVTASVNRGTDSVLKRHAALEQNIQYEKRMQQAHALTTDALAEQLQQHNMLANADDIHKQVVYHYVDERGEQQKKQEDLLLIQQRATRVATGQASPEELEAHHRVIADLVSHQAASEEKVNKTYNERLRVLTRQVKAQEEYERTEKHVEDLLGRGTGYIVDRARAMGLMVGPVGRGTLHYVDRSGGGEPQMGQITEEEFGTLIRSKREETLTEEEQQRYADIRESLRSSMGSSVRGDKGSDTGHFRITEVVQKLARGDFGGAIGELMQRIPSRRLDELNVAAAQAGERITQGLGGGTFAGMAGRALPEIVGGLTTPAGLIGLFEASRRGLALRRQTMQTGMITGQGFEAGMHARNFAFMQGINPFDFVSQRQAMEFQIAARQQGYTGGQANQISNLLGDVVNHLGTDWKEALQMTVQATQEGGSSLKDFRNILMGLRDTARDTGNSVQTLQTGLANYQTYVTSGGGTSRAAGATYQGLITGLRGTPLARAIGAEHLGTFLQESAGLAALQVGVSPLFAEQMTSRQAVQGYQRLAQRFASQKPEGMSWANYSELLRRGVPMFQGMTVREITGFLQRGAAGQLTAGLTRHDVQQSITDAQGPREHHTALGWFVHHPIRMFEHPLRRANPLIVHNIKASGRDLSEIVSPANDLVNAIWNLPGGGGRRQRHERLIRDQSVARQAVAEMQREGLTPQQMTRQVVEIKMAPELRRWLLYNIDYQNWLKGHRGGQAIVRPPGG